MLFVSVLVFVGCDLVWWILIVMLAVVWCILLLLIVVVCLLNCLGFVGLLIRLFVFLHVCCWCFWCLVCGFGFGSVFVC